MRKVVINPSYGGYYCPEKVAKQLGVDWYEANYKVPRHHPTLVKYVEEHPRCGLHIEQIGDLSAYYIDEYDGLETLHELKLDQLLEGYVVPWE